MTELAVSVRFQTYSSVLAGSAPAANYKPTHPQLAQENYRPTKRQQYEEKDPAQTQLAVFLTLTREGQKER